MKFTFELNGVKVERNIPTDWTEVSYQQLIDLGDATKEIQALSVFTGIPEAELRASTIKGLDKMVAALGFLKHDIKNHIAKFPKKILGYTVDQSLEFEPYGVYLDIKDESEKINSSEGIDKLKRYPMMCAIYLTKPYNFKQAEILAEQLYSAPCTEVLALGNFLLMKLIALNSTINPTSLKRLTLLRRLRLVLKAWRARLAFQVRFFIFNLFHRTIKKPTS